MWEWCSLMCSDTLLQRAWSCVQIKQAHRQRDNSPCRVCLAGTKWKVEDRRSRVVEASVSGQNAVRRKGEMIEKERKTCVWESVSAVTSAGDSGGFKLPVGVSISCWAGPVVWRRSTTAGCPKASALQKDHWRFSRRDVAVRSPLWWSGRKDSEMWYSNRIMIINIQLTDDLIMVIVLSQNNNPSSDYLQFHFSYLLRCPHHVQFEMNRVLNWVLWWYNINVKSVLWLSVHM